MLWINNIVVVSTYCCCFLDSSNTLCQHCYCVVYVGVHCRFLGQNVDHDWSTMVTTYSEELLLALKSRSAEYWSVTGFVNPQHFAI